MQNSCVDSDNSTAVKVSIVVTVYNREDCLSAAVESFLAQTYRRAELLLWDDGSTDGSLAIARKYASQDDRIKVIPAQHQGRVNALYDAMELASGDYIGLLDSDDLLRPTAIEETAAVLDVQPDVGMVYTNYWVINAQGDIEGLGRRCLIPYSKDRLLVDFMTFHFRLFRKVLYRQAGKFDKSIQYAEDYDLCLKFSELTEIRHIESALYCYRSHSVSLSSQRRKLQIRDSARAINHALKRRKLDQAWTLTIAPGPSFVLQKKSHG